MTTMSSLDVPGLIGLRRGTAGGALSFVGGNLLLRRGKAWASAVEAVIAEGAGAKQGDAAQAERAFSVSYQYSSLSSRCRSSRHAGLFE